MILSINDNLEGKFYVVSDEGDFVKAIYKTALGDSVFYDEKISECSFENTIAYKELVNRTATWSNAISIYLPSVNDIVGEFDYKSEDALTELVSRSGSDGGVVHLENLPNVPFYALIDDLDVHFFTNSVMKLINDSNGSCKIYIYGGALVGFPYLYVDTGRKLNIRPMIEVAKENVVGGVINDDMDLEQEEDTNNDSSEVIDEFWEYFV